MKKIKFTLVIFFLIFSSLLISCVKCNLENSFSTVTSKTISMKYSQYSGTKVFEKYFSSDSMEISFETETKAGKIIVSVKDKNDNVIKIFEEPLTGKETIDIKRDEVYFFEMRFLEYTGSMKISVSEADSSLYLKSPEPVTI